MVAPLQEADLLEEIASVASNSRLPATQQLVGMLTTHENELRCSEISPRQLNSHLLHSKRGNTPETIREDILRIKRQSHCLGHLKTKPYAKNNKNTKDNPPIRHLTTDFPLSRVFFL